MSFITAVIGRVLIGLLFIISGANKLLYPAGFAGQLESANLLPAWGTGIAIFEIVAGLLLALGLMTRLVSVVLAVYTLMLILFFYNEWNDYDTGMTALRLLAVTGGLLLTFAYGNVRGSLDHYRNRNKTHEAELRAARAEGEAAALRDHVAEPVVADRHPATKPVVVDRDPPTETVVVDRHTSDGGVSARATPPPEHPPR